MGKITTLPSQMENIDQYEELEKFLQKKEEVIGLNVPALNGTIAIDNRKLTN